MPEGQVRPLLSGPIVMIGMMGSGKTTIGRALARALALPFVDLDHDIVQHCGVSIPTIFDIEGEEGFRRREHQALQRVLRPSPKIVATGGGAPVSPDNQALLRDKAAFIIYLQAPVSALFDRIAKDANRPLLQTPNPKERVAALLAEREPVYQSLAHCCVSTVDISIYRTVCQLEALIHSRWQLPCAQESI